MIEAGFGVASVIRDTTDVAALLSKPLMGIKFVMALVVSVALVTLLSFLLSASIVLQLVTCPFLSIQTLSPFLRLPVHAFVSLKINIALKFSLLSTALCLKLNGIINAPPKSINPHLSSTRTPARPSEKGRTSSNE